MKTIMYKLVEQNGTTKGGMTWAIGKLNKATGESDKLCTDGVLHCYSDPKLAVLFNPIHGDKKNPILYKIECSPVVDGDGLKFATKQQKAIEQLTLPVFTKEQRVAFAIKCALLVFKSPSFIKWAEDWLIGVDRSESAAESAARSAARSAAWSARSAARSARSAARSAAESARSAAWSAESAAWGAWSAESAAWGAWSAAESARSAAESAAWGAESASKIFIEIADWVLSNI